MIKKNQNRDAPLTYLLILLAPPCVIFPTLHVEACCRLLRAATVAKRSLVDDG
jgi:hypothetical protein